MDVNKYEVVQEGRKCNIYELDVPEINNVDIISSIKNTVKQFPRLNGIQSKFLRNDEFTNHTDLENFTKLIVTLEMKMKEIYLMENIDSRIIPTVNEYWCAAYKQGNNLSWHSHSKYIPSYTGVYYAQSDDITPLAIKDESSENDFSIIPKKGTVIFFPIWVLHMVPALPTDNERLIVGVDFVNRT